MKCSHEFEEVGNYNTHVKTHDEIPFVEVGQATDDFNYIENIIYNNLLEYFATDSNDSKWIQQNTDEKLNDEMRKHYYPGKI